MVLGPLTKMLLSDGRASCANPGASSTFESGTSQSDAVACAESKSSCRLSVWGVGHHPAATFHLAIEHSGSREYTTLLTNSRKTSAQAILVRHDEYKSRSHSQSQKPRLSRIVRSRGLAILS